MVVFAGISVCFPSSGIQRRASSLTSSYPPWIPGTLATRDKHHWNVDLFQLNYVVWLSQSLDNNSFRRWMGLERKDIELTLLQILLNSLDFYPVASRSFLPGKKCYNHFLFEIYARNLLSRERSSLMKTPEILPLFHLFGGNKFLFLYPASKPLVYREKRERNYLFFIGVHRRWNYL